MGNDQLKRLIRVSIFLCTFTLGIVAQEKTPFIRFVRSQQYTQEMRAIETSNGTAIEKINAKIFLSSKHKNQEDLIDALTTKIELTGETSKLRYLLGGANGIKALQMAKLFSLPYVKVMLNNFNRAVAIDSTYTPALEAIVEALCQLPSVLGGDFAQAKHYAEMLYRQRPIEGLFALGYVAKAQKNNTNPHYEEAFQQLKLINFCAMDLDNFFANKSMNFPYKIAEISVHHKLNPTIGLCAIDYFIANRTVNYNLPVEWIYYRKGQLLDQLGHREQALIWLNKAVVENANFTNAINYINSIQKK